MTSARRARCWTARARIFLRQSSSNEEGRLYCTWDLLAQAYSLCSQELTPQRDRLALTPHSENGRGARALTGRPMGGGAGCPPPAPAPTPRAAPSRPAPVGGAPDQPRALATPLGGELGRVACGRCENSSVSRKGAVGMVQPGRCSAFPSLGGASITSESLPPGRVDPSDVVGRVAGTVLSSRRRGVVGAGMGTPVVWSGGISKRSRISSTRPIGCTNQQRRAGFHPSRVVPWDAA